MLTWQESAVALTWIQTSMLVKVPVAWSGDVVVLVSTRSLGSLVVVIVLRIKLKRSVLGISWWSRYTFTVEESVAFYLVAGLAMPVGWVLSIVDWFCRWSCSSCCQLVSTRSLGSLVVVIVLRIKVSLLLENILNLELDESSEFHSSKILTERTIHRYIVLNDKVGAEEAADAPKVKKAPVQRAVSKERPAAATVGESVLKKKRTMRKKSGSSQANLEIVAVAQEAVPIQIIEPIPAAPADDEMEEQPADEVAAEYVEQPAAEAEITIEQPADEVAGETIVKDFDEPAVETTAEEIRTTSADDVDIIIKKVIADTAQMGPDAEDHGVVVPDTVVTPSDTDEEMETIGAGTGVGDQQLHSFVTADSRTDAAADYFMEEPEEVDMSDDEQSVDERIDADEAMSLEDILLSIPADVHLPSEEARPTPADDVDFIIEQVIAETSQIGDDEEVHEVGISGVGDQTAEIVDREKHWFDLPYEDIIAQMDAERLVVTASDTDEEMETIGAGTGVGDQQLHSFVTADSRTDAAADYFMEEPEEVDMSDDEQSVDERIDADEAISLEDILLSIPADVHLPSAGVNFTNIILGKDIKLPGVDERTWYLASLPQIPVDDKGKEPLMEKDPVKEVEMSDDEQSVDERIDADEAMSLEDILLSIPVDVLLPSAVSQIPVDDKGNEPLMEKDPVQGNPMKEQFLLILADIECLVQLREKVIDETMLSVEGTWVIEPCADYWKPIPREFSSSTVVIPSRLSYVDTLLQENRDRGAVIARSNTNTKSSCWIRTMLSVEGTWVIEPCADYWKPIPREFSSSTVVIPSQLSYVDTLPPVSEFFKVMTKRWSDVCLEVIKFFASRRLLPVGSVNFCRAFAVVEPFNSFVLHQPTVFALRLSQFCTVFLRKILRNLQLASASVSSIDQEDKPYFIQSPESSFDISQRQDSPHSVADSPLRFISNAISMADDTTRFSNSLSDLQTLLSERIGDSQNDVLSRLHTLDKGLRDALLQQGEDFRNDAVTADSMDIRKEFRALNAKAQETLNHIADQLSELISYINRGGNDKKGEVSSSRPQPPPDDQNRGSGNTGGGGDNVKTTNIMDRYSGSMSRDGHRRGRSGGRRSSSSRSGSSKRKHPSSAEGHPSLRLASAM
ncbi:hypothetical protein F511_25021 [Dorcoceras hygrometricum]|uniref:Uncharacterized protein n=1 Tax=Dorcoceras hygrometricum TaxID=472368 RepID=A0A2Z7B728_9LAMI|nr:hypothetical protein F511_25021 [Dorcoceras hygrometricum]